MAVGLRFAVHQIKRSLAGTVSGQRMRCKRQPSRSIYARPKYQADIMNFNAFINAFNANSGSLSSRFSECSQSSLNSRDQSDTRASTRLTRVSLSPLVLAHELRLWTGLAVYSARGHSIASVILFPVSPGILRTRLPSKERSNRHLTFAVMRTCVTVQRDACFASLCRSNKVGLSDVASRCVRDIVHGDVVWCMLTRAKVDFNSGTPARHLPPRRSCEHRPCVPNRLASGL